MYSDLSTSTGTFIFIEIQGSAKPGSWPNLGQTLPSHRRGVQLNAPYASSLEMTKGSSWGIITVAKPRMINQRASHDYDNAS